MFKSRRATIFTKIILILLLFSLFNIAFFFTMVFENQTELISELSTMSSRQTALELRLFLEKHPETFNQETLSQLMDALHIEKLLLYSMAAEPQLVLSMPESDVSEPDDDEYARLYRTTYKSEFVDMIFHQELDKARRLVSLYVPFFAGEVQHVARIETKLTTYDDKFSLLVRQMLLGGSFILLAYLCLFIFTNSIIVKPIKVLSRKTTDIAKGDFSARVKLQRYDEIGHLANNFNEMAVAVQRLNFEALNANPLTGLPGNNMIVAEIEKRIEDGQKFGILYCDLDNFKAYNDKYGFVRGDHVILYSKEVFSEALRELNLSDTFVGHEGGDDFVLVTQAEHYTPLAELIIRKFDSGITSFYNKEDAKNGFIVSLSREGLTRKFPFVAVSIGIVTNEEVDFFSYPEIITVASDMKKHAKSTTGSCYEVNRRKIL
jgi:diguanylate cyclase (GGDEF)-like protein